VLVLIECQDESIGRSNPAGFSPFEHSGRFADAGCGCQPGEKMEIGWEKILQMEPKRSRYDRAL